MLTFEHYNNLFQSIISRNEEELIVNELQTKTFSEIFKMLLFKLPFKGYYGDTTDNSVINPSKDITIRN